MQSQRSDYRQQFLPEIDHRVAILQAYMNTLNSFQGLESETVASEGTMVGSSHVSTDRFIYNLMILDGMIEGDKTPTFKQKAPASLVDLMDEMGDEIDISKVFRYWSRVDSLMREQGMFTTPKKDFGHL